MFLPLLIRGNIVAESKKNVSQSIQKHYCFPSSLCVTETWFRQDCLVAKGFTVYNVTSCERLSQNVFTFSHVREKLLLRLPKALERRHCRIYQKIISVWWRQNEFIVSREYLMEVRVSLIKYLSSAFSNSSQHAGDCVMTLLDEYQSLCVASDILKPFLAKLVSAYGCLHRKQVV